MNLTEQTVTGNSSVTVNDSLNAALLEIHMKPSTNDANYPDDQEIYIYVDKNPSSNPSNERKQYVFDGRLFGLTGGQDELVQELKIVNNEPVLSCYVIRRVGIDQTLINPHYLLNDPIIEARDSVDITLFEGTNYIYSNYPDAEFTIIYPKATASNKYYVSALNYARHKENASDEFSLDDIYFKDAFTRSGNELNEEIDNLNVKCITSKNNNFSLDSQGNLIVNSITTNSTNGLLDLVYPVGSIYMSVNSTSPATLFGGSWEQIKDKFLLSSGDTYTNGDTGGEATHLLTAAESGMPNHYHNYGYTDASACRPTYTADSNWMTILNHVGNNGQGYGSVRTQNSGAKNATSAHNNMPPYLVVNVWKRVL